MVVDTNMFGRIRVVGHDQKNSWSVCRFWKQGKCSRNPCRFVHGELPSPSPYPSKPRSNVYVRSSQSKPPSHATAPQKSNVAVYKSNVAEVVVVAEDEQKKIKETVCQEWISGNCLKGAWNLQSGAGYDLTGPTGQVYALEVGMGVVFAGAQDGVIWGWKTTADEQGNLFQPAAALVGHKIAVVSLRFGAGRLFSGSMDGTIKVWDGSTFKCIDTLKGHEDAVMSLLCFSNYLLSCSLDHKIKAWGCNKEGRLEAVYTHEEADGALALCGVELNEKPLLLCSWNNDSVGVYELPSFAEKGRMYSKGEVRSMGEGPGGLVFTGDASGLLTVWKLAVEAKMVA
ncbi:Zinc finger CCCH domain-containing protein 17 [Linum perenne]